MVAVYGGCVAMALGTVLVGGCPAPDWAPHRTSSLVSTHRTVTHCTGGNSQPTSGEHIIQYMERKYNVQMKIYSLHILKWSIVEEEDCN